MLRRVVRLLCWVGLHNWAHIDCGSPDDWDRIYTRRECTRDECGKIVVTITWHIPQGEIDG